MAKIILMLDGNVLLERVVTTDRVTIGRRPNNDVVIDNLAISGAHAAIVTVGNDSYLEDLNSTNGTLVNGQPIKKHFLQDNDVIELGKYQIKFLSKLSFAQHAPGAPHINRPAPSEDMIPTSSQQATITVLNGAGAGKQLALTKVLTTLGRTGLQVAVISHRQQGYFLDHVEGVNRPLVNGQVIGMQTHPLVNGDVIELAGTQMQFALKAGTVQ